jgi:hypothetical protein
MPRESPLYFLPFHRDQGAFFFLAVLVLLTFGAFRWLTLALCMSLWSVTILRGFTYLKNIMPLPLPICPHLSL